MRRHISIMFIIVLAVSLSACGGVAGQHKAINYARLGVEASAIAADAADKVVHDLYGNEPASDMEAYCKSRIAGLVFAQVRVTLNGALNVILVWERALSTYEAKKEMGSEAETDWSNVLSSEAEWMKYLADVAAVLEGVRMTLKIWGVEIPPLLDKGWRIISGMSGKPGMTFEFTFNELKESICFDKVPSELTGGE